VSYKAITAASSADEAVDAALDQLGWWNMRMARGASRDAVGAVESYREPGPSRR
jgi:hypothetical protein